MQTLYGFTEFALCAHREAGNRDSQVLRQEHVGRARGEAMFEAEACRLHSIN